MGCLYLNTENIKFYSAVKSACCLACNDYIKAINHPDHIHGNPDADITILIATGCHRSLHREE